MASTIFLSLALFLPGVSAAPRQPRFITSVERGIPAAVPEAFGFFNNNTIYSPKGNETVGYPRVTELIDGSLLATCTLSNHFPQFFPIFKSSDGGATWTWISNVGNQTSDGDNEKINVPIQTLRIRQSDECDDDCDDDPGDDGPLGLGAQPSLLQITEKIGNFAAGTILASGNRMGMDSTNIDLYASTDNAKTWSFVTTIAEGGPPTTGNGGSSIWEPFLMQYEKTVIAYYSDSRDQEHGQKLSHQVSSNLQDWQDPVDDVAYPTYADRPGMTVVSYIPSIKQYMLVYEYGAGNRTKGGNRFPDKYKLAKDPRLFAAAPPLDLQAADSRNNASKILEPGSAPYVVWSPAGGVNGTIIVTDANHKKLFINTKGGSEDAWETRDVAQPAGYARALHVLNKYSDHVMILGAGPYRAKRGIPFNLSVVNVTELVSSGLGE